MNVIQTKLRQSLYVQVILAILIGVAFGHFYPELGEKMKPLGDAFIKLIKMLIAPIIFCTVTAGIASMKDMKKAGRVGLKSLLYFELLTTVALLIGLVVVNVMKPGVGMHTDIASLDASAIAPYTQSAEEQETITFLMNIIPNTVIDAFSKGDILQVLLFSILFGIGIALVGENGHPLVRSIDRLCQVLFGMINIIMKLAPIGAFGAMAFTIGKYGIGTLHSLGELILTFYLTCCLFIFVILGAIARICGFNIFKFLRYIKEEILIVLGTSSSESALPRMIYKMEKLGCSQSVAGMVIPTGYSFNLDGSCIYFTMAAIFIAQATNTPVTLEQQFSILAVLLLTSKGAAAVTGGAFITLAATLSTIHTIPVAGIVLILGIDRFMSEARAITNLIGNGIATVVISKWEKELNYEKMQRELNGDHSTEE